MMRPSALAFALVAFIAPPALAQSPPPRPPDAAPKVPRGERTGNLDFLLGALKVAPDDASAKSIEDRIWALWMASGSDTANLLMSRVRSAVEAEDVALALRLLDAIIEVRPQYAEAWHRRATLFAMKKDYAAALADLRQVLRREPRHFGALVQLGTVMQDMGDEKNALDAYRKALAIHPRLKGVAEKIQSLTEKVEGRAI
jgi:tetratricopeptide (TPR) repeat protein